MNSGRWLGAVFSVLGFIIAVAAGLFLAVQVSRGALDIGGTLLGAGLAFIPVALLVGSGIYLYSKHAPQEPDELTTMRHQRDLLDMLKSQGQVSLQEAAHQMNLDLDAVKSLARELIDLRVFSGYIDWNGAVLFSAEAADLDSIQDCRICGSPVDLPPRGAATCRVCGTEYFTY